MRQSKASNLQLVLGSLFLILLAITIFWFLRILVDLALAINPEVAAAIIAAMATILVSVFSVLASNILEQQIKNEQENRLKKVPVYESFVEFIFKILKATKRGEVIASDELEEFMFEFAEKSIVWGSDEVIRKFCDFRQVGIADSGSQKVMLSVGELLLAIRKDLGHQNKEVDSTKLLSVFINDLENLQKNRTG